MNIKDLTIGEIAKVEELSGLSVSNMGDADAPKAKLMAAMAYVVKRREDPKFKFEDALNMKMAEIDAIVEAKDEPKSE